MPQQVQLVALEPVDLLEERLVRRPRRAARPLLLADAARLRRRLGARHTLQASIAVYVAAADEVLQVVAGERGVVARLRHGRSRVCVRGQVGRGGGRGAAALLAVRDDGALRQRPSALEGKIAMKRGTLDPRA